MGAIKRLIVMVWVIDNALMKVVRNFFPTAWRRDGECRRCGRCCREIYLTLSPAQAKSPLFLGFYKRWLSWLFDFELIRFDADYPALLFKCGNQRSDGSCGVYFWRPPLCRNYPLIDYFKEPIFLPGCGYTSKKN
ncbi:hypothetical protein A3K48_01870 [candidate division WOR-1 bacterium RIFOXYA12_FULL_52_29]|uniref:Uncharacterized protein n=1 Tax=candidate division WOR-1 bacterium RIFOXYC12_FULL_54_18 TaxID=1802584 RepID=A0A1F4T5C9_UNCSA|nr:MAG: hypothetical protein A3K44_01870 [candidate division WOR-1 bacterium RIFOXYA2_FULL_51_19]OGC17330.1 MAG: hypothetical protein A3K48_01870 [candidate division WOR-1 bacterium RIFOXYA12_FULL_52_29]OGC26190.1 MAG: hypothetical protein A3K32_01865 [candidate division WOR-1 bacterium RIFOXYB2_FULL_45_9]OGC27747.1 MAG: hypothetical protein A3K49_01870 [candidate division WOR-1 bacterium RIFOXYC12_FULL_54_18]OGC29962.1 MAG: hypothetical protein A2346_04465 [candidate division WOR-1 bacterium R